MDRLFGLLFGGLDQGIAVTNARVFLSFVLSGCFAYLLAKRLTGSCAAAAVAGFAFTYSPYHLAMGMQYGALASIQWIPLYLLALVNVLEQPTRRTAALAEGAMALDWSGRSSRPAPSPQ